MNKQNPVRIIGGGMTGLTVALRLAQRGVPVVVHERDPYLGGLSSESTLEGIPIERYYHCVLPTDTHLLGLLRELGIEDALRWRRTRTGFYHDGSLIEMTTVRDFLRFPAISPIDRLRLAWTIGYCGMRRDWTRFDRESVSHFLRRHGGERLFKLIWEPLLLSKLGSEYDRFSASFIWATIVRLLSARGAGVHHEQLGSVSGRYGRVFRALRRAIEKAGGHVIAGLPATGISRTPDNSAWIIHSDTGEHTACGVVLCVPAPAASELLQGLFPQKAAEFRRCEYLGVVCEVLVLRRSLTPYYVLNLTDRRLPFTGIIEFTNLAGCDEFGGHSVVYLPQYCGEGSILWEKVDGDIHRENMKGLRLVVPDLKDSDIVGWVVHRARHVQPVRPVGGRNRIPEVAIAPGLAYVSTAQIYPWPIFNDAVVRHVDQQLDGLLAAIESPCAEVYSRGTSPKPPIEVSVDGPVGVP